MVAQARVRGGDALEHKVMARVWGKGFGHGVASFIGSGWPWRVDRALGGALEAGTAGTSSPQRPRLKVGDDMWAPPIGACGRRRVERAALRS
jgi:hypothetical protein